MHFERNRSITTRVAMLTLCAVACKDFTGSPQLPAGQQDPSVYDTPGGATQQGIGVVGLFRVAFDPEPTMTDELTSVSGVSLEDQRSSLPNVSYVGGYFWMQQVRVQANLASGALGKFAAKTSPALHSEVLSAEGYMEVLLADRYCSGIPLSTLDYEGNFTYQPGSPTTDVYRQAVAIFDTAITLAGTDTRLQMLARVGRGRALLGLGAFDSAASSVASVGNGLTYTVKRAGITNSLSGGTVTIGIGDREGHNGLPFVSEFDPRIDARPFTSYIGGRAVRVFYPAAYGAGDSVDVVIASSVEARLIEAEAMLHRGEITEWLAALNRLRTDGTTAGIDTVMRLDTVIPGDPSNVDTTYRVDTLWNPGTGGVRELRPLTDPGAALDASAATDARVDLQFHERAFWMFMSGHRLGDMRRLVRQYGRNPERVYPTGIYPLGGVYGPIVNFGIPPEESSNPRFTGCLNRGA